MLQIYCGEPYDGNYLYALDPETAKLAVFDIARGKEIKVVDKLGTYPLMIFPLPESKVK
jgi:hypothetical protein